MRLFWWVIGGLMLSGAVASAIAREQGPSTRKAPLLGARKGTIYLIGDSLSAGKGTLGGRLAANLRGLGYTVEVNAIGGRSANTFIAGSKSLKEPAPGLTQISEYLASGAPDAVIVLLGTNDLYGLASGNKIGTTKANFNKIVDAFRAVDVPVIGIGAPHYKDRKSWWAYEPTLREALIDVYGEDYFIDAGPLTEGYKMHAGGASAQGFADRLTTALQRVL